MIKKSLLLAFLLLAASTQVLQAQILDRFVPHAGFSYAIAYIEDVDSAANIGSYSPGYYTFSGGTYFTLGHHNDWLSHGVDLNGNFGINFANINNNTLINLFIQPQLYYMGRIGAASTSYNQQKVGLGLGVGGVYTYLSVVQALSDDQFKIGFVNPSALVEVNINTRGTPISARAYFSPIRAEREIDSPPLVFPPTYRVSLGHLGFSLLYGF